MAGFLLVRSVLSAWGVMGVALAEWTALVTIPVLILRYMGLSPWAVVRLRPLPAKAALGAVLVGMAGPMVAWCVYWLQERWIPTNPAVVEMLNRELLPTDLTSLVVLLGVAVLTPAICEEYAVRGLLLQGLRRRMNVGWAIGISALAFGLLHWSPGGAFRVPPTVAVGMLLGWAAWRTGSLLGAIVVHLTHNLVILLGAAATAGAAAATGIPEVSPAPFLLMGLAFLALGDHFLAPRVPSPPSRAEPT